ncbi:maleylpyruvate isomerase N-terminal domain-containing protein [Phytomonospora sp. NPDC050363]|uniref:maleylpyruvate isomerase N-terminal domain-containing protein n=1 Tax=Phytomonospora sp. NPDC050363 TaxID=3155642 RepID=UPI00340DCB5D
MHSEDFLSAARVCARLLRNPRVAAEWAEPSALREFSVGGLAGHLAFQILALPAILEAPLPPEPAIGLLDHYSRVEWIGADLDADINVRIRAGGDEAAADGPKALADRVDAAITGLAATLPTESTERPVRIPFWGPWSLTLDDLLVTRLMELAVHADDLAVSVGLPTPRFGESIVDTVLGLLTRLSARRHGAVAVMRALSRAERAPKKINAF